MYTIRATRRGIDRTEKSILARGPALERGVKQFANFARSPDSYRDHNLLGYAAARWNIAGE